MRQQVPLKTYSKMSPIKRQPNAILKFCLMNIGAKHWCKAGVNTKSDLATESLTLYVLDKCPFISITHSVISHIHCKLFGPGSLSFFLISKSVV